MGKREPLFNADMARMCANSNSDYEYRTEKKKILDAIEETALQGKFHYRHNKEILVEIQQELRNAGFEVRKDLVEWHGKN